MPWFQFLKRLFPGRSAREGGPGSERYRRGCRDCEKPGTVTSPGNGKCKYCGGAGCSKDDRSNNGLCRTCSGSGWEP